MKMKLSAEVKTLCSQLTYEENKSPICKELKNNLRSEEDESYFILWLLQAWSFSSNKYHQYFGQAGGNRLNVCDVCMVVKETKLQRRFAQILLLLPEIKKRHLIQSICREITSNRETNRELSHHLYHLCCHEYCQNFMATCSYEYDATTIKLFSANLTTIVESIAESTDDLSKLMTSSMTCLDCLLLDCHSLSSMNTTLDLDKYAQGKYIKRDTYLVRKYQNECLKDAKKPRSQKLSNADLWKRLEDVPCWWDALSSVTKAYKLALHQSTGVSKEKNAESLAISVGMKLKVLCGKCHSNDQERNLEESVGMKLKVFCGKYHSNDQERNRGESVGMKLKVLCGKCHSNDQERNREEFVEDLKDCLEMMKNKFDDSDLLVFVCGEDSTVDEISDMQRTCADDNLFSAAWINLKNTDQKFLLALRMINGLFPGHQEVFQWLLEYTQVSEKYFDCWTQTATVYIVNHCTFKTILKLVTCITKEDSQQYTHYIETLRNIVVNCLSYLTVQQLNTLMLDCEEHYMKKESFLWCPNLCKNQLQSELNEIINKMTDTEENKEQFDRLMVLSFVSPYLVVNELLSRIFDGNLKNSFAGKIFYHITSLLTMNFSNEWQNEIVTLFTLVKINFDTHQDDPSCQENLVEVLVQICKCGDKSSQGVFIATIIDELVYPNLCSQEELPFPHTMNLLSELQNYEISISHVILLLEILLCYIKPTDEVELSILQHFDMTHRAVQRFVDIIQTRFGQMTSMTEKDGIVSVIKQLLLEHDWSIYFYFRPFFCSFGIIEKLGVPRVFADAIKSPDQLFNPLEEHSYTEEYGHWVALFEIFIINKHYGTEYIEFLPVYSLVEEFDNLVASATTIFSSGGVNKFRAQEIVSCIDILVSKGKLEKFGSHIPEELEKECFLFGQIIAFLVMLQSFSLLFTDDVIFDDLTPIQDYNLQSYPKIMDMFNKYLKNIENLSHLCTLGLFMLDSLLKTITSLGQSLVDEGFSLLLMDTLLIFLKTCKNLPPEQQTSQLERCKQVIQSHDGSFKLKAKFDEFMAKL